MTLLITIISNYLIYLLASAVVVGGWWWREIDSRQAYLWWVLKFSAALVIAYGLNLLVGYLHPEARPFVVDNTLPLIAHPADNSFPSDHATLGAVMAIFIGKINVRWGVVAMLLVLTICATRVLAKLHYPTDVVVGLVIGTMVSLAVLRVSRRLGG